MLRRIFDKHGSDKGERHAYERVYEPAFEPVRHEPLRILEVGVFAGNSLRAWEEYFPSAEIVGVDLFERVPLHKVKVGDRVRLISGDSTRVKVDGRFDIVIDDGAHDGATQAATFNNLKDCADRYFVEDFWLLYRMSAKERKHTWLLINSHNVFSKKDYVQFMYLLDGGDVKYHDLREGYQPDSFILEIA